MTWKMSPIGTVIHSSQYGLSLPSDPKGSMPIVGMKDIQDGRVRIDPDVRVNLTEEEAAPYLLKDGDILLNRTNSPVLVGKTGIYRGDGKAVFASYLVRLELDRERVDPDYVIQILASESGQRHIRKLATRAVSQANINPTTFKSHFQIPLPTLKEQVGIRDVLMAWDIAARKTEQLIAAKEQHYSHELSRLISPGHHSHGSPAPAKAGVGTFAEEVSARNRGSTWRTVSLSVIATVWKGQQLNKDAMVEDGAYYALNGGIKPSGRTTEWNCEADTITVSSGGEGVNKSV